MHHELRTVNPDANYRINRKHRWLAIGLLMVCASSLAQAQEPRPALPSKAWQVDADRIEYDQANQTYVARGNVRIEEAGYTLTADRVQFNRKTSFALAEGNVLLLSGQDKLSGPRLRLNLDTQTGTLSDGAVFFHQNHLYLTGETIEKTGPRTYTAKKVRLTSCDGADPDWQLTGSDFRITLEGYGTARHTALWAGKMPLLYSPFLVFPVKLKRQTGLLMAGIELSDRRGTEYIQPFFWALGPSSDATLWVHSMPYRGLRTGIEYRYVLGPDTMGTLIAEGFNDQKVDDGTGETTEQWGYGDDDDLRTNQDRYWLRMKHDQAFDNGLKAKLDLDLVSDQDYLREFKTAYTGFSQTRDYFQKAFGREIDDYNDAVRLNRFNLNRSWKRYTFNVDLRWYDDVVKRREATVDDTLRQLPTISFDGVKQQIGKTPFYHDLTSSYTNFHRFDGPQAQRADLYPRIYQPFDLFGGLTLEPSAGLRQTAWRTAFDEHDSDEESENHSRTIYDFKLDTSIEVYRIFDFNLAGCDRLKHTVTPEVIYQYIPEQEQSELPDFDALDRIQRKNLVTYGVNNTFTARAPRQAAKQVAAYTYTPFLRFKLSQSFDINKYKEEHAEPYTDIKAELDLTPGRHIAIDTDANWSAYDHRIEGFNSAVKLWSPRGDKLSIDYRYTRQSDPEDDASVQGVDTIGLVGEGLIDHRWRARGGIEHNRLDDLVIDYNLGLSYQGQCWGVDFDYRVEYNDERDNYSFSVIFNLLGLGGISAK